MLAEILLSPVAPLYITLVVYADLALRITNTSLQWDRLILRRMLVSEILAELMLRNYIEFGTRGRRHVMNLLFVNFITFLLLAPTT